ncbi:MAG: ABC transporter permease, partial [Clostridia bacterium]|nr:ABC transporter permease [Clostridia bacterium]
MKKKQSILRYEGVQTLLASLLCILGGLFIGFIVLLIIEPSGAWEAITAVLKSYFRYSSTKLQLKYLGQTLTRTAPLLMCSLSVLFAYKVGMFNIGAAGQYVAGACAALYVGIGLHMPWWVCLIAAMLAGALLGAMSGALKTFCNVNVVISGIMLNWIALYVTNMTLSMEGIKNPMSPYTVQLRGVNPGALIPQMGLNTFFGNEKSVTIAIPLAIIMALVVWFILNKTKFGYELKATGYNFHAAKYSGMKENRNIILTMMISGALAGMGAALLYLTGIEEWETTISSVPG